MEHYPETNARAIDKWAEEGWVWGRPISHEAYLCALQGELDLLLTPLKFVPRAWYPELKGAKLLGLASGGGQQMPVFAAQGAVCTVLDYSEKQLESERMVAEREGYAIEIVRADMTKRLPFGDNAFDMIFHPVSNCYVEDVYHVWRECFRVLKPGGVLLAGMDNGLAYLVDEDDPLRIVNRLPYNPMRDEAAYRKCFAQDGSVQFSHTFEEQVGGQLKAGLVLTDLYEDWDDSDPACIGAYCPLFLATRAVKPKS